MTKAKKSDKACACCGEYAGKLEQWPNQDTGTALCRGCVTWIKGRNSMSDEEFTQTYGHEGVHYPGPAADEKAPAAK